MTAGETYIVCFVGVLLVVWLGLWLETRLAVPAPEPEPTAFDLFRERRAGIDRTRAEIQALPELGDGAP